jgi:hypothetical protein
LKRFFLDYTSWLLIAVNVYLILYYRKFPNSINDIIVLFYIQSVLIGVFNFFDMLTIKQFAESDFKLNTPSVATKAQSKNGCGAWFFLLHYGFFHLVYLFFLVTLVNIKQLDFRFIEFSFFIILATCISGFVQNKIRNRNEDVNIVAMFFMPYARIIPMHLMILLPAFLHISGAMLFLVLKMLADVIMHVVYQQSVFKQRSTV